MIGNFELINLLNKYGIDGKKLIKNNPNVLKYGVYDNIEDIIIFLKSIGISSKNIEKCPSILSMSDVECIKSNYNYLIDKTDIKFSDIENCLHILCAEKEELYKIYNYISNKYGIKTLKQCPSIFNGNYDDIVSLTETLERTIGLDIVKDNGGSMLIKTTSAEFLKILSIPEFKYNPVTKNYNKDLLTISTFYKKYDEIKEILGLKYWQDEKFKPLLTANIWRKDANQIKDILELKYWQDEKFKPLLTSNIWRKDENQIKEILELKYWQDERFKPLLTPTIWLKDAIKIKEILELKYWQDEKFKPLLTPTIWLKDMKQIKETLELKYWQDEKFKPLLTVSIWHKNASQIKEILELEYWQDEKFKPLLTANIWRKDANQIKEILELKYWQDEKFKPLLTSSIWHEDARQIKEILELKYWQDERFKPLLTSSIWLKSAKQIKEILELEYWQDEKFKPLLIATIWLKNANQIKENIEICMNYGLNMYANNPTLIYRVTSNELIAKINYLNYHNIPLVENTKGNKLQINNIFGMSNKNMQKKYGISKKELIRDYLNIEVKKCSIASI